MPPSMRRIALCRFTPRDSRYPNASARSVSTDTLSVLYRFRLPAMSKPQDAQAVQRLQVLAVVAVVDERAAVVGKALACQADVPPGLAEHERGDAEDRDDDHRRHLLDFPSSGVAEADIVFPDGKLRGMVDEADVVVVGFHLRGIDRRSPHDKR